MEEEKMVVQKRTFLNKGVQKSKKPTQSSRHDSI